MSIVSLSAIFIKLSCRPAILEHWIQNNIVTMIYNIMIHVTEIDTFTKIKLFSKLKIINNIRFGLSKPLHHHHRSKITRSNSLRPMQFILPASVTLLTTGSHTPLQLTSFADYTHTHTHTRPLHIPRFTFRSLATRRTWSPRWHFPPRSRPCKIESAGIRVSFAHHLPR